jgi:hypothetical protein
MENEPLIQTKLRRTHLGVRYDLYINGTYRATAYTAREIEPALEKLLK